jgi:hypothetical protein
LCSNSPKIIIGFKKNPERFKKPKQKGNSMATKKPAKKAAKKKPATKKKKGTAKKKTAKKKAKR